MASTKEVTAVSWCFSLCFLLSLAPPICAVWRHSKCTYPTRNEDAEFCQVAQNIFLLADIRASGFKSVFWNKINQIKSTFEGATQLQLRCGVYKLIWKKIELFIAVSAFPSLQYFQNKKWRYGQSGIRLSQM